MQGLPVSGYGRFFAASFHVGLFGLWSVYTAFWLHFDLLTTLVPLAVLAAWLSVSGYGLLSSLSSNRLKEA